MHPRNSKPSATEYAGLERAIQKALAKEKGVQVHDEKVTWVARIPIASGHKEIYSSKDPVVFLKAIATVQEEYPHMKIYIFKVIEK